MTEQEAVKELRQFKFDRENFGKEEWPSLDAAISALEEIRKYRALGTVDELKKLKKSALSSLELANIWAALEKLKKYEAAGTVEELRKAGDRQRAEAPYLWGDGYDNDGNPIYDMYECPGCGKSYETDGEKYDYCPNCGQAIDWR